MAKYFFETIKKTNKEKEKKMFIKDMKQLQSFWAEKKDRFSQLNIEELKKVSFIPFIGSGMSVPFGYPDWKSFLANVINEFVPSEDDNNAEFEKLLICSDFLKLAEKLNIYLNNSLSEEVRKAFHKNILVRIPKEKNYLYYFKQKNIRKIVTTNFDEVIESNLAFDAKSILLPSNLQSAADVVDSFRTKKDLLIKLHGSYEDLESIILTETDFNNSYNNSNTALVKTVEYIWNSSVFLFMGC